jgi:hypothetical protein
MPAQRFCRFCFEGQNGDVAAARALWANPGRGGGAKSNERVGPAHSRVCGTLGEGGRAKQTEGDYSSGHETKGKVVALQAPRIYCTSSNL